jgi:DNA-binding transcriptional LysR family regulator
MVPTDAGSRWVVRFERVLAELRNIRADIAALKGVLEGVVTVGALPLGRIAVADGDCRRAPAPSASAFPDARKPV